MKKGPFIATLLILLGVTWTLYLEHRNKVFTDNLPKAPMIGVPSVGTVEDPATSENEETIVDDVSLLKPSRENIPIEDSHTHTHAHPHPSASDSEPTKKPSEEQSFEMQGTLNLTPARPSPPKAGTSLDFFLAEERAARETIERVRMNPDNWMRGKPGEPGFILGLTESDWNEVSKANYVLNPIPENRPVPFRPDSQDTPTIPTQETHEVIQLKGGYTFYLPRR